MQILTSVRLAPELSILNIVSLESFLVSKYVLVRVLLRNGTNKVYIWRFVIINSHDYEGFQIPRSVVRRLETQES